MWYGARMCGCVYHWIDSKKSVGPWVELLLQGDHNDLAALSGHHPEKSCNLHRNRCLSIMADREHQNSTLLKIESRLTLPMFVLSRAASTSSSTKNGAGRKLKIKQRYGLQFSPTVNACLFIVRYYFTINLSMGLSGCSPVNGKDQSESGDGLLSSWQVVHGHETFPRSHTVIVDAIQVGLIWILST